jgi:hypothetical protein
VCGQVTAGLGVGWSVHGHVPRLFAEKAVALVFADGGFQRRDIAARQHHVYP